MAKGLLWILTLTVSDTHKWTAILFLAMNRSSDIRLAWELPINWRGNAFSVMVKVNFHSLRCLVFSYSSANSRDCCSVSCGTASHRAARQPKIQWKTHEHFLLRHILFWPSHRQNMMRRTNETSYAAIWLRSFCCQCPSAIECEKRYDYFVSHSLGLSVCICVSINSNEFFSLIFLQT